MSKKLNEDAMASELAGSAFFQATSADSVAKPDLKRPLPKTVVSPVDETVHPDVRTGSSTTETSPAGTAVRTPVRRVITRYAFEFYQDQIEQLRNTALQQKLQGELGSMSEMVREALDLYLTGEEGQAA